MLHACGNLEVLMPTILDARIDGRLTLADEKASRKRVRDTLDVCQPGGGYCLGSGNTVANYIPLDNYLMKASRC